jgi:hypothetical protein
MGKSNETHVQCACLNPKRDFYRGGTL